MATLLQSESRRLYSWWWDSHISPKSSKWLQDNLTDMDSKVKAMIKLIEEDADSFARRAEMYYKKRPELMKLVEEFYRAYRALAERYDHATVELRHAHKIMAEAFPNPNQLPFDMTDDSASSDADDFRDSPRISRRNSGLSEDSHCGGGKKGLKQLNEMLGSDVQVEALKKTLAELLADKEALHLQYQLSLQKLSNLEKELSNAQDDAGGLDERASKAEIEIKIMGEALTKLEAERDAGLLQYNQSMDRISNLEAAVSRAREDAEGLDDRASKAEIEAQQLNIELSRLQAEKEAGFERYKRCLEMISALEDKIKAIEESVRMFGEQTERAEAGIDTLTQELLKLQKEKDVVDRQHQWCLETIAKLEGEIARFQDNAKRLNAEVQGKAEKLKHVEDQCAFLETSNQTLQLEADSLAQKIVVKDRELFEKENELEKVQTLMQDERSRFEQLEASLKDLQSFHCQSQEEQKALELELQSRLQMLRDLEIQNHNMEDKISQVEEENHTLTDLNNSSSTFLQIQQNELLGLKEVKEKLEEEVARQVERSNVLQDEVHRIKKEIDGLNQRYLMLLEQVKMAGLNPESVTASVKIFKEENSKLIELCNNQRDEKNAMSEKLKEMDEILQKNSLLENSLLKSNMKLEGSREKVKDLQERCASLGEEKSGLVAERGSLLSHLQIMTENMQKLLEKNTSLESSLSGANIELEGLRAKSKCLEEFFQMLKDEKTELLKERENLVGHLNRVEEGLGVLEKRFSTLEGKCAELEKEKQFTRNQVEELKVLLVTEKQERNTCIQSSESRLADVQNHVSLLQEECRSRKKEFEEELDRSVNAQVEIFILQKFIEDLEQKNYSLLIERQKYVEASKFSEKIIAELGSENLEQQMEADFLIDEIENLRSGIYQVFEALQFDADHKVKKEQIQIPQILGKINELKSSVLRNEDEKQHLVVENSVFLSLLEQCRLDGSELESKKDLVEKNMDSVMHRHETLQKEHWELLDVNTQLKSKVIIGDRTEKVLRAELETQHEKLERLQEDYSVLERQYSSAIGENKSLLESFSQLKDEMRLLDEENSVVLQEAIVLSNMSLVYQCFGLEKNDELEASAENLSCLQDINTSLKQKVETLQEELKLKQAESLELHEKLMKLDDDLSESNEVNAQLKQEILVKDDVLREKGTDLEEAEQMLKATQNMNAELCRAVEEVKEECEASKVAKENLENQVSELFERNGKQRTEIEHLNQRNGSLETEVKLLHEEVEEQRVREEYLSLELQEKSNEFGIWDSEATSFYFDLQISSVREVLLENKVHELTEVCENFRAENAANSMEIEQMKQKVGSMENEMGELKSELSAYAPIVASLRQDLESLERTAQLLTNLLQEPSGHDDVTEVATACEEPEQNRIASGKDGILHMQDLQIRIRAIEQAMLEERNRLAMKTRSVTSKEKDPRREEDIEIDTDVSGEIGRKIESGYDVKNGLLMKDIPLDQVSDSSYYGRSRGQSHGSNDQMLELWEESPGQDSTIIGSSKAKESPFVLHKSRNRFVESQVKKELGVVDKLELSKSIEDKAKILERLVSDSRKLASLRTSLREMKMKMEADEKKKHGRTRNPDHDKVKNQLKEAEAAILSLTNTTEILSKDIEETGDARDVYRKRVSEQSHMVSEKTENLQFDVQNIERIVLKLDDGAKAKGRKHFSESRTVVLLRDIIHKSGKRTGRKKKSRFCGCIRSSTRED